MNSHLGHALWRFSVDALTKLLTYGEGTRLAPPPTPPKVRRRRSPRAPDAFGVQRRSAPAPASPIATVAPTAAAQAPPQTRIRTRTKRKLRMRAPVQEPCVRREVRFDPLPVVIVP